jgi:hypothetical protein
MVGGSPDDPLLGTLPEAVVEVLVVVTDEDAIASFSLIFCFTAPMNALVFRPSERSPSEKERVVGSTWCCWPPTAICSMDRGTCVALEASCAMTEVRVWCVATD